MSKRILVVEDQRIVTPIHASLVSRRFDWIMASIGWMALPRATLALAREDSRHQKTQALQSAFYRELS